MKALNDLDNEFILIGVGLVAIGLLKLHPLFGIYSLILSLLCLALASWYYSHTFFSSTDRGSKLYYFFGMMALLIIYFAIIYKSFGIIDTSTNVNIEPDWKTSIYFSVVTWTTLGYGDYKPNEATQLWAIAEALLGYVFMGLLVGKVIFIGQLRVSNRPDKAKEGEG